MYSVKEIAEMLNITVEAVRNRIKKRNIQPTDFDTEKRCAVYSEEQFELIKKNIKVGRPGGRSD